MAIFGFSSEVLPFFFPAWLHPLKNVATKKIPKINFFISTLIHVKRNSFLTGKYPSDDGPFAG
jgi:hypothetical protein